MGILINVSISILYLIQTKILLLVGVYREVINTRMISRDIILVDLLDFYMKMAGSVFSGLKNQCI